MKKKINKAKEPSLIRKLIDIHHEQAMRRKAIRYMEKQAWSFDFLSMLLVKAGKELGNGIMLELTDKNGVHMRLTYNEAAASDANKRYASEQDIFDKLDDAAAVESFISAHSTR